MVIDTETGDALTYEDPPAGSRFSIVDPYDGCTLGCPYGYQRDDPTWSRPIRVKTNLPGRLRTQLTAGPSPESVYVGSRCDPYMPLESKYRLTRRCTEATSRRTNHGLDLRDGAPSGVVGEVSFREHGVRGPMRSLSLAVGARTPPCARAAGLAMTKAAIHLTRHGQTEWNLLGRQQGHLDSHLTSRSSASGGDAGIDAREDTAALAPQGLRLHPQGMGWSTEFASFRSGTGGNGMNEATGLDYLYHYYERRRGPLRNLSDLPLVEAREVLDSIGVESELMAASRYLGYLETRREPEPERYIEAQLWDDRPIAAYLPRD